MKIGSLMVDAGIHCYVEASRRGAHLWGSVDEQVPAKVLRRMMRFFIEQAGVPRVYDAEAGRWVDDARVELRPGADQLAEGALGHALRMPTMPHPKTGKRYQLFYPWGPSPLEGASLGENLLHLLTTPKAKVVEIATDYVPLVDPRHLPRDMDRPKPPRGPDEFENASASEILRDLWGVQNARPGIAVKCPAHDDQHPSLSITRDDRRAICHGPGCILNNDGRGRGTFELTKYAPATSRTRASCTHCARERPLQPGFLLLDERYPFVICRTGREVDAKGESIGLDVPGSRLVLDEFGRAVGHPYPGVRSRIEAADMITKRRKTKARQRELRVTQLGDDYWTNKTKRHQLR
jgi:hypothetical protein